jgi:hypothetical protein
MSRCYQVYDLSFAYDLEISRQLNSMKSSRAIRRFKCLYETDVSRTVSVIVVVIIIIITDLMCQDP